MSDNYLKTLKKTSAVLATGFSLFLLVYGARYRRSLMEKLQYAYRARNPLKHREVHVIEDPDDCKKVVSILKKQTAAYKVIGFDCEWVQESGKRRSVALLQLASLQGFCALFRLNKMQYIPKPLRDLLEDDELLKVGVSSFEDAEKLRFDFGVDVPGTFDIRYLASMTGYEPNGLAKLASALFNIQMDKSWRVSCSDWEQNFLTNRQIRYAANDALIGIELFFKMASIVEPKIVNYFSHKFYNVELIKQKILPYYDVTFKRSYFVPCYTDSKTNVADCKEFLYANKKFNDSWNKKKEKKWEYTKAKPFYHNCLLEAPDGDLLCTIDYRRACWYTQQKLGFVVSQTPFTVRLNFEPSGRAVGEVGRFYQTRKEDQCVVCGQKESFIRKNVVPREYRKHFPVVMKKNTSHDVLLLCPRCHYLSDMANGPIRERLAKECNAPLKISDGATKYTEDQDLRKIKLAGKVLLSNTGKLPSNKRIEMESLLKAHFETDEITNEILHKAAGTDTRIPNSNYVEHGLKVVQTYEQSRGGLIQLEKLWRENFINTMRPKYLPELWSVNHNLDRLQIRAEEGRVSEQELRTAGVDASVSHPKEKAEPASFRLAILSQLRKIFFPMYYFIGQKDEN